MVRHRISWQELSRRYISAKRVIPQMGYTQIWGVFMPKQLDNYFKLRLDEHAQL